MMLGLIECSYFILIVILIPIVVMILMLFLYAVYEDNRKKDILRDMGYEYVRDMRGYVNIGEISPSRTKMRSFISTKMVDTSTCEELIEYAYGWYR